MDAPKALYASRELSYAAKALGALMWTHARPNREPFVWPKQKTLAEELGCDVRRVGRLLTEELIPAGFAMPQEREQLKGWLLTIPQGTGALHQEAEGTGALPPGAGTLRAPAPPGHPHPVEQGTGALLNRAPAPSEDSIESKNEDDSEAYEEQGTGTLRAPAPSNRAPAPAGHPRPTTGHRRPASAFSGPGGVDGFERQLARGKWAVDAEQLLERHGDELFKDLDMFDGINGRPTRLDALKGKWNAFQNQRSRTWDEPASIDAVRSWLQLDALRLRPQWERDGRPRPLPSATTRPKKPPELGEGEYLDAEGNICAT